jgi:hypothetical protein
VKKRKKRNEISLIRQLYHEATSRHRLDRFHVPHYYLNVIQFWQGKREDDEEKSFCRAFFSAASPHSTLKNVLYIVFIKPAEAK